MFANLFGQNVALGALLVRLALGAVFIAHGYQKLFVAGMDGTINLFRSMGVAVPELFGPLVAFVEFFGGIAIVLGLFTRYVALMLGIVMAAAIVQVKLSIGFIAPMAGPPGYELDVALLACALLLLFAGPGALSLEKALFKREL